MIRIKNWGKYQSYKDRKPPWIRFHRSILDDYKFQKMSAEARAMLPMFWLLACEHENPKSGLVTISLQEITFRLRQQEKTVTEIIQELQDADFIECIETVTESLQDSNENVTPETETETETETEYIAHVVCFLNEKLGTKYKPTTSKTKSLILARKKEGFKTADFEKVIVKKYNEWSGTDFETYLRPETLFGTKFESYLNGRGKQANKIIPDMY